MRDQIDMQIRLSGNFESIARKAGKRRAESAVKNPLHFIEEEVSSGYDEFGVHNLVGDAEVIPVQEIRFKEFFVTDVQVYAVIRINGNLIGERQIPPELFIQSVDQRATVAQNFGALRKIQFFYEVGRFAIVVFFYGMFRNDQRRVVAWFVRSEMRKLLDRRFCGR